jgi:carbonic anhydrase
MVRRARDAITEATAEPSRRLAVVTCMDARVDPPRILNAMPGEIHVIRNAGGIVTDDVLRSLLISQHRMGTQQVLVMMHTGCGMLGLRDEMESTQITSATGHRPPFSLGGFADLEQRLRESVQTVRSAGFLPHTDKVRGAIYELEQDRLENLPL